MWPGDAAANTSRHCDRHRAGTDDVCNDRNSEIHASDSPPGSSADHGNNDRTADDVYVAAAHHRHAAGHCGRADAGGANDERWRAVSEEGDKPTSPAVHRWIGLVGLFVAPTTVITSLCYFYGYVSVRKYFDYFGIDSNAIGFTTSDYVIRSVRALYLPIILLLLVWLILLWAVPYVRTFVDGGSRPGLVRAIAWTLVVTGALGLARGIVGMTAPSLKFDRIAALTPIGLCLGSAALVVGVWMVVASRATKPLAFGAAARSSLVVAGAAIVAGLFWITQEYAIFRGEDDAETTKDQLWTRETGVVLDTRDRLAPPTALIKETRLAPEDPALEPTLFRYECFRTLAVQGDRWVLVPAKWTNENGYAVIVTAGPANRISVNKLLGIAKSEAGKWNPSWQCPEVHAQP